MIFLENLVDPSSARLTFVRPGFRPCKLPLAVLTSALPLGTILSNEPFVQNIADVGIDFI